MFAGACLCMVRTYVQYMVFMAVLRIFPPPSLFTISRLAKSHHFAFFTRTIRVRPQENILRNDVCKKMCDLSALFSFSFLELFFVKTRHAVNGIITIALIHSYVSD